MLVTVLALTASLASNPSGVVDAFNFPPAATPIETLESISSAHPALLGMTAEDALTDVEVTPLRNGHIVRARRLHAGVPVIDEALAVRFDSQGRIIRIRSDFRPLELDQAPRLSLKQAQIAALKAAYGFEIKDSDARGTGPKARLVIDPAGPGWVYAVYARGVTPDKSRIVLIDAVGGKLVGMRSTAVYNSTAANVYQPHPNPNGSPGDTTAVSLSRLQSPEDETQPLVLNGEHVISKSCLTSEEEARILTCDDMLPLVAGSFAEGMACSDFPQFVPEEYLHLAVALCGVGHRAIAHDEDGFVGYEPIDTFESITEAPYAAFDDEFAEVQLYYHIDHATEWFQSLGHPTQDRPLDALVNVSMPSGDLFQCGRDGMTAAGATDHDTGVQVMQECITGLRAEEKNPFGGFDNAFFSGAGGFTSILGLDEGGIFMGQGTVGDFAYDGDVMYHEFGHAIASQVGALQSAGLEDSTGLNDAPGALNEAYADYFAASITGDPVVGGYIGARLGTDQGIRTTEHNLRCPEYWIGEVHDDSLGWGGGLWAARQLYPQVEIDEETGLEVRVFDRVVYEGLLMLTSNITQDHAAEETIEAVKSEPLLGDPNAELVSGVFEERNLMACERIRPLTTTNPIPILFLQGTGAGNNNPIMGGGATYSPYAPGPVQLSVDIGSLKNDDERLYCATFAADIFERGPSMEEIPDTLGGDDEAQAPNYQLGLLYSPDAPVHFTYSGSTTVSTMEADNKVELALEGTTFRGVLEFPEGAQTMYYAIVNSTSNGFQLANLRIESLGQDCPNLPEEPADPTSDVDDTASTADPAKEGCGCRNTTPDAILMLGLALIVALRRRRRTSPARA